MKRKRYRPDDDDVIVNPKKRKLDMTEEEKKWFDGDYFFKEYDQNEKILQVEEVVDEIVKDWPKLCYAAVYNHQDEFEAILTGTRYYEQVYRSKKLRKQVISRIEELKLFENFKFTWRVIIDDSNEDNFRTQRLYAKHTL